MALRTLVAATAAAVLAVASQVQAQAPLVPTALVEDVKSTTANIGSHGLRRAGVR